MRRILCGLLLVLMLWGGGGLNSLFARPLPTPLRSASREFIVYGKRRDLVAYAMRRADTLADHWNSLFRMASFKGQQPIIIYLVDNSSSGQVRIRTPFNTKLLINDEHQLKVQLDVFDLSEIRALEFDWRILQAMALRSGYTASPPAVGDEYRQPPHWIVDAALQDVLDAEGDFARAYAAALVTARNLDLKTFLAERPEVMDAVSLITYRVKARALLQSLMELPNGSRDLRAILLSPVTWDDNCVSLIARFPTLKGSLDNLTKAWLLNLARPTVTQRAVPLTSSETAGRLDAILRISLPEGVKAPKNKIVSDVELFPLIAATPRYRYMLREKARNLLLLSLRAHPMYRPLIDEYREIVETLLRSPRKNLSERIKQATRLQNTLNQRYAAIEDYLNWFEATVMVDASQPFQSVLENDQRRRVPAWHSDAISRALDAAEAAGW